MIGHRAAWVLPITAPPIRDGWVAVDAGRVVACGCGPPPLPALDRATPFGQDACAIVPALVNAHTHLELSYLRGLVPPSPNFDTWLRALLALRRQFPDPSASSIVLAAGQAIQEARSSGTGVIGDISNTLVTARLLHEMEMPAHLFHEVLGFNLIDATDAVSAARLRVTDAAAGLGPDIRVTITPHAPYSVAPALFMSIAKDAAILRSIHLGESPEEVQFLEHGGGPIQAALEWLGVWNPQWTPPRCGPVEYMERFGLVSDRLLAVHGVQFSDSELARLAGAGATLVTCPRSNRWVGVGSPPVERFYESGVRVAIGTDSLASVEDLNVFAEMAAIRALSTAIPAREILKSATRNGAEALGFGADFGAIEPGKRAALLAVRIPAGLEDVEEYLVGGIAPHDVAWLESDS